MFKRLSILAVLAGMAMLILASPAAAAEPPLSWTVTHLSETMYPVSCPSESLCVAGGRNVVTSTNPTGGAAAWTSTQVYEFNLSAISCPSASLCVGVDQQGNVVTSTNPTGGTGAWTVTHVDAGNFFNAISCPSASLCVGVDGSGNAVTSTNPTGGAGAWTVTHADGGNFLSAISCPSASLCVAIDYAGNVVTSTNPTGGAGAWTVTHVDVFSDIPAISCPSASLCVAGDFQGDVLTSTNPTGGTGAWTLTHVDEANDIAGISCPSASLCVASDYAGNMVTSTNPTGGASNWTVTNVDETYSIHGVSCPSASLCVAVDEPGNVLVGTPAVGTGNTLTVSPLGSGSGTVTSNTGGINCPGTCSSTYPDGTIVTLTATPSLGSYFAGWGGSGACSGTATTCDVKMSGPQSVQAGFALLNQAPTPHIDTIETLCTSPCEQPNLNSSRFGSFTPNAGGSIAGGETVTITGSNFISGTFPPQVTFNNHIATVIANSPTSLTVTAPPVAIDEAGVQEVAVDTIGGLSNSVKFTYYVPQVGTLLFRNPTKDDKGNIIGVDICTASVVAKNIILTAGHCATRNWSLFENAAFAPGYFGAESGAGLCPSFKPTEQFGCGGTAPYGIWQVSALVPQPQYAAWGGGEFKGFDFAFGVVDTNSGKNIQDLTGRSQIGFCQGGGGCDAEAGSTQQWNAFGEPNVNLGLQHVTEGATVGTISEGTPYGVPGPKNLTLMPGTPLAGGASGGPWINKNTGEIGAVNSGLLGSLLSGAYLGRAAQALFNYAQNSANAAITVSSQNVVVAANGNVAINITCLGQGICRGTDRLTVQGSPGAQAAAASVRKHKPPHAVVLGRGHFSVRADRPATIHIRLTAPARKLLRKHHNILLATLTIKVTGKGSTSIPMALHSAKRAR